MPFIPTQSPAWLIRGIRRRRYRGCCRRGGKNPWRKGGRDLPASGIHPCLAVLDGSLFPGCFSRKITGGARLSQVLSRIMSPKAVQTKEWAPKSEKYTRTGQSRALALTIAVNDLEKGDSSIGQWDRAVGILKGNMILTPRGCSHVAISQTKSSTMIESDLIIAIKT